MDEGHSLALITVNGLYSVVQVGSENMSFSTEKHAVCILHHTTSERISSGSLDQI